MLQCAKISEYKSKQSNCCVKLFYVIQKTLDLPHPERTWLLALVTFDPPFGVGVCENQICLCPLSFSERSP